MCSCRICVLTLAESHPVVSQRKNISKIDFLVDLKVSVHSGHWLWLPCVADADIIFLPCGFYLSIFFPGLISAAAEQIGCLPYFDTWCGPSANL